MHDAVCRGKNKRKGKQARGREGPRGCMMMLEVLFCRKPLFQRNVVRAHYQRHLRRDYLRLMYGSRTLLNFDGKDSQTSLSLPGILPGTHFPHRCARSPLFLRPSTTHSVHIQVLLFLLMILATSLPHISMCCIDQHTHMFPTGLSHACVGGGECISDTSDGPGDCISDTAERGSCAPPCTPLCPL